MLDVGGADDMAGPSTVEDVSGSFGTLAFDENRCSPFRERFVEERVVLFGVARPPGISPVFTCHAGSIVKVDVQSQLAREYPHRFLSKNSNRVSTLY